MQKLPDQVFVHQIYFCHFANEQIVHKIQYSEIEEKITMRVKLHYGHKSQNNCNFLVKNPSPSAENKLNEKQIFIFFF